MLYESGPAHPGQLAGGSLRQTTPLHLRAPKVSY